MMSTVSPHYKGTSVSDQFFIHDCQQSSYNRVQGVGEFEGISLLNLGEQRMFYSVHRGDIHPRPETILPKTRLGLPPFAKWCVIRVRVSNQSTWNDRIHQLHRERQVDARLVKQGHKYTFWELTTYC